MNRVELKSKLLRWACERGWIDDIELSVCLPTLGAWISHEARAAGCT